MNNQGNACLNIFTKGQILIQFVRQSVIKCESPSLCTTFFVFLFNPVVFTSKLHHEQKYEIRFDM